MSRLILLLLPLALLSACTGSVSGDPADIVERYIQAKAESNGEAIEQLLCSEMESVLTREIQSFSSVEARTEGVSCLRVGESDVVSCAGKIIATYGLQDREFPLTSYRIVQEDGEWRWCGESE